MTTWHVMLTKALRAYPYYVTRSLSRPQSSQKLLYLSLIRSRILYCSPVWHPHLIKDINQSQDFKPRLISLGIFPLMMQLELININFFVKSFKFPSSNFEIMKYFNFFSGTSQSSKTSKLHQCFSKCGPSSHFFFRRFPRLWNSLPTIALFHLSLLY